MTRKHHLYEKPQGQIQKIQIAVAGKLASYMDSSYFAAVIVKIIPKLTEKAGRVEGRGPLGHPLNPLMVPMGSYNPIIPMVIRQHPASHAYFQSRISTQFFFRSLLPGVPRLNIIPFGF